MTKAPAKPKAAPAEKPAVSGKNDVYILLDDFLDRHRERHAAVEDLKNDIKTYNASLKGDIAEMKMQGFDTKALKVLMQRATESAKERDARLDLESQVDLYSRAVGLSDD